MCECCECANIKPTLPKGDHLLLILNGCLISVYSLIGSSILSTAENTLYFMIIDPFSHHSLC